MTRHPLCFGTATDARTHTQLQPFSEQEAINCGESFLPEELYHRTIRPVSTQFIENVV